MVSRHKNIKEKAVFLATQARDNAPHYQHSEIGHNYRLSNICAGIGRGQMEVLDKHIALRRKMNDWYREFFADVDGVRVLSEPDSGYFSNHWLSAITIDAEIVGKTREDLRLALEAENIESRPLWKPMHLQPVFSESDYYGSDVCEKLFENGLCLPSGSNLGFEEIERIKAVFVDFFATKR